MADPATWRDRYKYLRAQRDIFARRATECRKLATEARKQRRWLDALRLSGQASENDDSRIRYADEARAARAQLVRNPYKSSSQGILDNSDAPSVTRQEGK